MSFFVCAGPANATVDSREVEFIVTALEAKPPLSALPLHNLNAALTEAVHSQSILWTSNNANEGLEWFSIYIKMRSSHP